MKKYRTLIGAGAIALLLAACNEEVDSSSAAESENKTDQVTSEENLLQIKRYNKKLLI